MVDRKQPPRAIDAPKECWLRVRPALRGGYVPARIYKSLGMLTAEVDGQAADVESVWTSGELITEQQYIELLRDRERPPPF
jgi:hypothetical protein